MGMYIHLPTVNSSSEEEPLESRQSPPQNEWLLAARGSRSVVVVVGPARAAVWC